MTKNTIEAHARHYVACRAKARALGKEWRSILCEQERGTGFGADGKYDHDLVEDGGGNDPCWKSWTTLPGATDRSWHRHGDFLSWIDAQDDADICPSCKRRFRVRGERAKASRLAGAALRSLTAAVARADRESGP